MKPNLSPSRPPALNFMSLWENQRLDTMSIQHALLVQRLFLEWYSTYFPDQNDLPQGVDDGSEQTRNPNF